MTCTRCGSDMVPQVTLVDAGSEDDEDLDPLVSCIAVSQSTWCPMCLADLGHGLRFLGQVDAPEERLEYGIEEGFAEVDPERMDRLREDAREDTS